LDPLPRLPPDGLSAPEVGDWAEEKYQHVRGYARMFSTSMRKKWSSLAYVDLYAGAGRSTIRGTSSIIPASATLALSLPFTRHVFCDIDKEKLEVLRRRVERDHPSAAASYVLGDVNTNVDPILAALQFSPGEGLLSFCLVDPYSLSNLRFETIRRLSERKIDFLVLVPSGYDFQVNQHSYAAEGNNVVADFLGDPGWRALWSASPRRTQKDGAATFIADRFGQQMASLGYIYEDLKKAKVVRSTEKNLLLYHLMLFSRHELGHTFWKAVLEYAEPQLGLEF